MNPIISIENFSLTYDYNKVINNINLSFEKNKITSIIGPSGCGKSTLLKSINKIILEEASPKITGDITFKNLSIDKYNKECLRKKIGYVCQTPTPFPFSIYKNMTYALEYNGIKDKKAIARIIEEKLTLVGLWEEVKDDLKKSALKLSGGQQQRLCIARALTVEPEVLLLDEPCSSLDYKNTSIIEEALLKMKELHSIIIVTHNLAQAKRISDYTAFIFNGEVEEFNLTETLFMSPKSKNTTAYLKGLFG